MNDDERPDPATQLQQEDVQRLAHFGAISAALVDDAELAATLESHRAAIERVRSEQLSELDLWSVDWPGDAR